MSTFGFMSTSIPLRERSPSTRNTAISTMTNTGRWIESRVKPIWMPPDDPDHHGDHPLRGYPRVIHRDGSVSPCLSVEPVCIASASRADAGAVDDSGGAGGDDPISQMQARGDLYPVAVPDAEIDVPAFGPAVDDGKHVVDAGLGEHRIIGN